MVLSGRLGKCLLAGFGLGALLVGMLGCGGSGSSGGQAISTKAQLGHALFFDTSLSTPPGMSCATCHSPTKAFTDPRPGSPTSAGVVHGLFGFRNAPTACYAAFSPPFQALPGTGAVGGQFWDGRAVDLPSQAKLPLLNPIEMGNPSAAAVVKAVQNGPFAVAMKQLYGAQIFSDPATAYDAITDAIAQFEKTPQVSPFSSKYDAYLKGKTQLSPAEARGLTVFNGKALCFSCHPSAPAADGSPPLFTNFTYDNIGLPKNPANPYYTIPSQYNPAGSSFIDIGLQVATGRSTDTGKFKTPTLRNIAVTGPYFHNGFFQTLAEVVNFYNTRDLGGFDPPEVPANEDTTFVGNLQLTAQEQSDLVSFLGTLTDGYGGS
jgi:cytochrome c peroxidase